jgi:hypothetical protein
MLVIEAVITVRKAIPACARGASLDDNGARNQLCSDDVAVRVASALCA